MFGLLAPLSLLACHQGGVDIAAAPEPSPIEDAVAATRQVMNPEVDPCEDFYEYACGGWLETTALPADRSVYGRGFSAIADQNRALTREILETAAADPTAGDADWRRMGDFYAACMNEGAIEAAGLTPLGSMLAEIEAIDDLSGVMATAGHLTRMGGSPFLQAEVDADYVDPDTYLFFLGQGGLGLPDRSYYLDGARAELLLAYTAHVAHMFELTGYAGDAVDAADRVVALETALAELAVPREELSDPQASFNKIDRDRLTELAGGLEWAGFFTAMKLPEFEQLSVSREAYFSGLDGVLTGASLEDLKRYLRWSLVNRTAGWLTAELRQADFEFYGRTLRGQQQQQDRWKQCSDQAGWTLGEIVGRAFVEQRFAGESKARSIEMIEGVHAALADALPTLGWMDDPTRALAEQKLQAITNKIGYPDTWRDYSALGPISASNHFANAVAASKFSFERQTQRIGGPVDRGEWYMPPQIVNAYYNPTGNEIVFPAGILQPPFFSIDQPQAMSYGGIGVIMGHETTHGFDDSGRKFDPQGRMVEWWAPEVAERFEVATQCVVDQYSAIEVQPDQYINGALTLGENIADIGGLKESYAAYKAWVSSTGGDPLPAGVDGDALFFLGFAQSWCTVISPEAERRRLATDSHSPARYRVNAALANVPAFAETFACEAGAPMAPESRCEVW